MEREYQKLVSVYLQTMAIEKFSYNYYYYYRNTEYIFV